MSRYFIHLAYCGAPFHGWQSQPNAVTVQSVIEDALTKYMRQATAITGAGRTDTGVNARMMIAHVDFDHVLTDAEKVKLTAALNSMVGPDIAIYGLHEVDETAHARFDATARTYHYYAHTVKSPFDYRLSWKAPADLDVEAMNRAAAMMLGRRDFTSFSKLHTDVKTNICNLTEARWEDLGEGRHRFVITADRFLRNMVRAVVGTLVEVGRHKISAEKVMDIIEQKDRSAAGTSMPAQALFLWNIKYPYITFDTPTLPRL